MASSYAVPRACTLQAAARGCGWSAAPRIQSCSSPPSVRLSPLCATPRDSSSGKDDDRSNKEPQDMLSLAPARPQTPYGEMLQYYLKMQPDLFHTAVEDQLKRMQQEKEAKAEAQRNSPSTADAQQAKKDQAELTLYKRMEEVRANEVRATLEDLMYVSILEKFVVLGIEMLPRMDGFVDAGPVNLRALTESIHSKEALELVREHLMGVMGPTAMSQFSNVAIKMSKFQMAQVYAASIMFGYFLRRVDTRFQLERSLGVLTTPEAHEDAVARLERIFAQADALDAPPEETNIGPSSSTSSTSSRSRDEDSSSSARSAGAASTSSSSSSSSSSSKAADWLGGPVVEGAGAGGVPAKKQKSALRRYVESFDQATMIETARIVSIEGAALVERQTSALLGDIKKLTAQVQEAVGEVSSMQEVMARMAKAVESDSVETVTMTVGTQRRAVLEAVAFGTFLRDVETHVDRDYGLLTIRPSALMLGKGGRGPFDDEEDEDDDDGGNVPAA